eukprot:scaffold231437_cov30-Tisochrysis_lutea.AAC.2
MTILRVEGVQRSQTMPFCQKLSCPKQGAKSAASAGAQCAQAKQPPPQPQQDACELARSESHTVTSSDIKLLCRRREPSKASALAMGSRAGCRTVQCGGPARRQSSTRRIMRRHQPAIHRGGAARNQACPARWLGCAKARYFDVQKQAAMTHVGFIERSRVGGCECLTILAKEDRVHREELAVRVRAQLGVACVRLCLLGAGPERTGAFNRADHPAEPHVDSLVACRRGGGGGIRSER